MAPVRSTTPTTTTSAVASTSTSSSRIPRLFELMLPGSPEPMDVDSDSAASAGPSAAVVNNNRWKLLLHEDFKSFELDIPPCVLISETTGMNITLTMMCSMCFSLITETSLLKGYLTQSCARCVLSTLLLSGRKCPICEEPTYASIYNDPNFDVFLSTVFPSVRRKFKNPARIRAGQRASGFRPPPFVPPPTILELVLKIHPEHRGDAYTPEQRTWFLTTIPNATIFHLKRYMTIQQLASDKADAMLPESEMDAETEAEDSLFEIFIRDEGVFVHFDNIDILQDIVDVYGRRGATLTLFYKRS